MYLEESEVIARKYPALASLVGEIDSRLVAADPAALLRVDDLAGILHADPNQVSSIFELLELAGAVQSVKMVECAKCDNLLPENIWHEAAAHEDTLECTSCGEEVDLDANRVTVYRQAITAIESAKERPNPAAAIASVESEGFPSGFTADVFQHTPLLHYYSNSPTLVDQQPFAGKRVYFVLHFLRDLLPFVESMERLGLAPKNGTFFYKNYPYPQQKQVERWLTDRGYKVLPRSEISEILAQLSRLDQDAIGNLLIIEDGGFFVPSIHRKFKSLIPHVIGAVEQTMRGIMNCREWLDEDPNNKLGFPVLSVATSKLKSDFEPRYIGQAVLQNIE